MAAVGTEMIKQHGIVFSTNSQAFPLLVVKAWNEASHGLCNVIKPWVDHVPEHFLSGLKLVY